MKKLHLFILLLLSQFCFSQTEIKFIQLPRTLIAIKDGDISDPFTFGGQAPKAGDNIIISKDITVTITSDVNMNMYGDPATTFDISGKLLFSRNGQLDLALGSILYTRLEGMIKKQAVTDHEPKIVIGNSAIFKDNDEAIQGPAILPSAMLPMSLLNVTVWVKNNISIISWTTAIESGSNHFEVQRSVGGSKWETLSHTPALGNANSLRSYLYLDSTNSIPTTYYRVKLVNNDGRAELSKIRCARNNLIENNVALTKASKDNLEFEIVQQFKSPVIFKLVNKYGKTIQEDTLENAGGNVKISLKNISKGQYVTYLTNDSGFSYSKPIRL
jgi:hypothetical protein